MDRVGLFRVSGRVGFHFSGSGRVGFLPEVKNKLGSSRVPDCVFGFRVTFGFRTFKDNTGSLFRRFFSIDCPFLRFYEWYFCDLNDLKHEKVY